MKVVAFVGPSGTGKSHRAIGIAHKNNCEIGRASCRERV